MWADIYRDAHPTHTIFQNEPVTLPEWVKGIEPSSPNWQSGARTIVLHPHAP